MDAGKKGTEAQSQERTLVITRVYDAPRGLVFKAWTRAEHLVHWWGPRGFTIHACESDPRPGGVFRLCMRSPEGQDYWVRGIFREVVAPERLVITCVADDEHGVARLDVAIAVTFAEHGGGTRLTLNTTAGGPDVEAAAMIAGMEEGWNGSLDRLDAHLDPQHLQEP